jgi:hypothetical protein
MTLQENHPKEVTLHGISFHNCGRLIWKNLSWRKQGATPRTALRLISLNIAPHRTRETIRLTGIP